MSHMNHECKSKRYNSINPCTLQLETICICIWWQSAGDQETVFSFCFTVWKHLKDSLFSLICLFSVKTVQKERKQSDSKCFQMFPNSGKQCKIAKKVPWSPALCHIIRYKLYTLHLDPWTTSSDLCPFFFFLDLQILTYILNPAMAAAPWARATSSGLAPW